MESPRVKRAAVIKLPTIWQLYQEEHMGAPFDEANNHFSWALSCPHLQLTTYTLCTIGGPEIPSQKR